MGNINEEKFNKTDNKGSKLKEKGGREVVGSDDLGLEDALDIAFGVKPNDNDIDVNVNSKAAKVEYIADSSHDKNAKEFMFEPEDELANKKAVKGSFDSNPSVKKSLTPTEQYADVTAQVLADGSVASESSKLAKEKLKQQKAAAKLAAKETAINDRLYRKQNRAHGDYVLEADALDAIAKNESYLVEVMKSRRKKRIIALIVLIMFLLFLLTFGVSVIITRTTGFTVNMTGGDSQKGLTLYDNAELSGGTSHLVTANVPECDNQTYSELVDNIRNTIDLGWGQQSMKYWYFAYSFLVQNIGKGDIDYDFKVSITSTSKGLDDAIRVMLIDDVGDYYIPNTRRNLEVYAKPKTDSNGKWLYDELNKPVMQKLYDPQDVIYPDNKQDNAKPFYDSVTAVNKSVKNLSYKEGQNLKKYTVVIYIEGGDEDCINMLKGGGIKFRTDLTVTDYRVKV